MSISSQCPCQGAKKPKITDLQLISELPDSRLYTCNVCGSGWELNSAGEWNLMLSPKNAGMIGDTQVDEVDMDAAESKRQAIDEGFRSFYLNNGALLNPHPRDSQDYNDFERGWTQALKRSNDKSPVGGFSQTSMAIKYDGAEKRHRKVVESAYNSYAAVKGKE